jgi:elongation factor Ts
MRLKLKENNVISAAMVKELREISGAGMMDAKKALVETGGDIELAQDWLRTKGLLKAEKKSSRIAAEGLVGVRVDGSSGLIVEVNSETDFVATNIEFKSLVKTILSNGYNCENIEAVLDKKVSDKTLRQVLTEKISTIGENISFRRMDTIEGENIYSYVHNSVESDLGKIGVLLSLKGERNVELGKQISMHIAATSPLSISENDLDLSVIEREKKVINEQLAMEGKPPEIVEKILSGKLKKFYEENTLLNQKFVMDPDLKIAQVLQNKNQVLADFRRYKVGEGIDQELKDFVSEVKEIVS